MYPEQLVTVFATIAETLLAVPLRRAEQTHSFGEDALVAQIRYQGAFWGALDVTFDAALARALAGLMIGSATRESRRQADAYDTIGEIANIAAGNLRGLLASDCQLSLPSVYRIGALPQDSTPLPLLAQVELWMLERPMRAVLRGEVVRQK
ncbi:MAG TPA: chemotaxis protein CheX [Polyangiales bacterium]